LLPAQYEQGLIKTELLKKSLDSDPFKLLCVPNQDKMAFFLLKWIFNAIKQEPDLKDTRLPNECFVKK